MTGIREINEKLDSAIFKGVDYNLRGMIATFILENHGKTYELEVSPDVDEDVILLELHLKERK